MTFALNFDIFFAIGFVGMVFAALFKKSKKMTNNIIIFIVSTLIVGLLVYFKVDVKLYTKIAPTFQPIMDKLAPIVNKPAYFGLFYFAIVLIVDFLVFFVIKLIVAMFTTERRKFKKDLTYTPRHYAVLSFISSLFKYAILLYGLLLVFEFVNFRMGYFTDNSFVIKFFEAHDPVGKLLTERGKDFFGLFGF